MTAFKLLFLFPRCRFRADVYSTVLSLVPGRAWQAQESDGWLFLFLRAAIVLSCRGMVSPFLRTQTCWYIILVYSKYLVFFYLKYFVSTLSVVALLFFGFSGRDQAALQWWVFCSGGSGRSGTQRRCSWIQKNSTSFDPSTPLRTWFFLYGGVWISLKVNEVPLKLLYLQAFSKQVCSPAKHLCSISCHTCVKSEFRE